MGDLERYSLETGWQEAKKEVAEENALRKAGPGPVRN